MKFGYVKKTKQPVLFYVKEYADDCEQKQCERYIKGTCNKKFGINPQRDTFCVVFPQVNWLGLGCNQSCIHLDKIQEIC